MRQLIVTAILLSTTPVLAFDAITYKGTLGRSDILVELTDPAEGGMRGRYSYMRVGGDIPLHNLDGIDSIELAEEAPCSEETCILDADGAVTEPPIGGLWLLNFSADGSQLSGTWAPADKPGKTLYVALTEIGRRTLPKGSVLSPMGLANSAFSQIYGDGEPFTAATASYDFAKMDVALTEGPVQTLDGSSFRFVGDPRSVFAFPRIVALADGSSPEAANRALAERHATINLAAFSCLNTAYSGFSYSGHGISMDGGSLGDFDGENIALGYLSPTVLGWTESGSTWCGGAHPNNHFNSFVIDVRTGKQLALGKVLKDWVATRKIGDYDAVVDQAAALEAPEQYVWAAGQSLIDYVLDNYAPGDAGFAEECGIEELITTNLGLRFASDDKVVFTLEGLPHVIHACTEDLLTVSLSDIPDLLAPTASDYFPSLLE
ncbi:hypothetical protein [Devosia sp.]|uniref:hypothetical protein n=1 Tax=Devosia sp. TaxID=1871048 RepID=UPI002FC6A960